MNAALLRSSEASLGGGGGGLVIGGEAAAALTGGGGEAMVEFFERWVKDLHSSLDTLGTGGGEPPPVPDAVAAPPAAPKLTDSELVKDISNEVSKRLRDLWDD